MRELAQAERRAPHPLFSLPRDLSLGGCSLLGLLELLARDSGQLTLLTLPYIAPCWGQCCPPAQPQPSSPQVEEETVGVRGGKETSWRGLAPCWVQHP